MYAESQPATVTCLNTAPERRRNVLKIASRWTANPATTRHRATATTASAPHMSSTAGGCLDQVHSTRCTQNSYSRKIKQTGSLFIPVLSHSVKHTSWASRSSSFLSIFSRFLKLQYHMVEMTLCTNNFYIWWCAFGILKKTALSQKQRKSAAIK